MVLQWGRRANTAERARIARQTPPDRGASMGPPCEHGGEASLPPNVSATPSMLQWGRRANTAESDGFDKLRAIEDPLQWGRRANTAESASLRTQHHGLARFNGAAVR